MNTGIGIKNKILFLLLGIAILLMSCNQTVVIKDFTVNSNFYKDNGYFLGNNKVKFEVELANSVGDNLVYYWQANGGEFLTQGENEVVYLTPKVPGNYNLHLEIKKGNKIMTTFNFPFTVKGDYPEKVTLQKAVNNFSAEGVQLKWSAYEGDDFYGYKILRSNNFYIDEKAKVIASIDRKEKTSYVDQQVKPDETYTYQVMVTNDRGYVSASNEEIIKVLPEGVRKIEIGNELTDIKIASNLNKGYIGDKANREILVLDLNKEEVTNKLKIDTVPKLLLLDKEEEFLFVLGNSGLSLTRINLTTLKSEKYTFSNQIKDITINDQYLYLLVEGKKNLLEFDFAQGKVKRELELKEEKKSITARAVKLMGTDSLLADEVFGPTLVYNLNDLSNPISQFDLGAVEDIKVNKLEQGNYLYAGGTNSQSIQTFSIGKAGKLTKKGEFITASYPKEFVLDMEEKMLFATYEAKEVAIFSLKDYGLKHKLKFEKYVFDLALDERQKKLYLLTGDIDSTNYNIMIVNLKNKKGNYLWNAEDNK